MVRTAGRRRVSGHFRMPRWSVYSLILLSVVGIVAPATAQERDERPTSKLPAIPKSSPALSVFCGISSLTAALRLNGRSLSVEDLFVPKYVDPEVGSSVAQLRAAAHDYELYTLPLTNITWGLLKRSPYPIIIHVKHTLGADDYDHFELFLDVKNGSARLFDAPRSLRLESPVELAQRMSGMGLIVSPEPIDSAALFRSVRWQAPWAIGLGLVGVIAVYPFARKRGSAAPRLSRGQVYQRSVAEAFSLCGVALLGSLLLNVLSEEGLLSPAHALGPTGRPGQDLLGEVTAQEMASLLGSPGVVIVDARNPPDYEAGHIPGAISIPTTAAWSARRQALKDVPPDARIIVYCQSVSCRMSDTIGSILLAGGFTNVALFPGGWNEWEENGI